MEKDPFEGMYGDKVAQKEAKRVQEIVRKYAYSIRREEGAAQKIDFLTQQIPDASLFDADLATFAVELLGQWSILEPPFPPAALSKLPVQNNTLGQCIEAMRTNVEMFGHTLEYLGKPEEKDSQPVIDEFNWITTCFRNRMEIPIWRIFGKLRVDYETLGWDDLRLDVMVQGTDVHLSCGSQHDTDDPCSIGENRL